MVNQQITDVVMLKKDAIKKSWLQSFEESECERLDQGKLEPYFLETVDFIINNFPDLIHAEADKAVFCEEFSKFGYLAYQDGFAFHDLISALSLLKKSIFHIIRRSGFYDSALNLYKVQEFHTNAVKMFDRATFYTAMGYEEGLRRTAKEDPGYVKILKFLRFSKPKRDVVEVCSSCKL